MRLEALAVAVALLGGACSAQISDGLGTNLAVTDAPLTDAPNPVPVIDAAPLPTVPPALCASRSVYLNFDGVTLTQGPSDATLNHASWMQIPAGTAPPYQLGNPDRDAMIQAIVDGVQKQLAAFPITVVKARPTSGEYVMIVLGGTASAVGSRFAPAVNTLDCGDVQHNDVAWIADAVSPPQRVINSAVGAIGFGLGLTATTDRNDCMCNWDNTCQPINTAPCKLGSPIARDPAANQRCTGLTVQDEVATLHDAFCGK
jgi:hypothetical protein